MKSRRDIIRLTALFGAPLLVSHEALAQAPPSPQPPMLDEKDPTAVALGYVADAARVDKAKYPNYVVGQLCSNCQLYQPKVASAPAAPCQLFPGKLVAAKGWCSAYVKKVA